MRFSQVQSFNVTFDRPDLSRFSSEEMNRLCETVERWRNEPAALLTLLLEIQEIWGYLPERVLEYVGYALRVPTVDLFAIVEFYDLLYRAPPGPRVGLCMNTPCAVRGGGQGAKILHRTIEQRPDLGFSLEEMPCQGCCDLAPVAVVGGSSRRLTPRAATRVAQSLVEGRLDRQPPMETGGQVRLTPTRVTFRNLHRPHSYRLDVFRAHGGYATLERVVRTSNADAVISAITESGLLGAGGAGFPAGRKWATVRHAAEAQKFIVVNADEGEPGTFKDRAILERDP
ncbi:MAG: NAD(P)H-dependent oxidoreductase subunit E, partial [Candidatus Methylomirabilales bacterium]